MATAILATSTSQVSIPGLSDFLLSLRSPILAISHSECRNSLGPNFPEDIRFPGKCCRGTPIQLDSHVDGDPVSPRIIRVIPGDMRPARRQQDDTAPSGLGTGEPVAGQIVCPPLNPAGPLELRKACRKTDFGVCRLGVRGRQRQPGLHVAVNVRRASTSTVTARLLIAPPASLHNGVVPGPGRAKPEFSRVFSKPARHDSALSVSRISSASLPERRPFSRARARGGRRRRRRTTVRRCRGASERG